MEYISETFSDYEKQNLILVIFDKVFTNAFFYIYTRFLYISATFKFIKSIIGMMYTF